MTLVLIPWNVVAIQFNLIRFTVFYDYMEPCPMKDNQVYSKG